MSKPCNNFLRPRTRREMLRDAANGFGMIALAGLLGEQEAQASSDSVVAATVGNPLAPRAPMFPAKAKRVIFLFMHGGPSQVDTFDPKPLLTRDSGKPFPGAKPKVQFSNRRGSSSRTGRAGFPSRTSFRMSARVSMICALFGRFMPTIRRMAARSCSFIPAAITSSARRWVRG